MENSNDKQSSWAKFSLRKAIVLTVEFFGLPLFAGLVAAVLALLFFGWLAEDVYEKETIGFDQTVRNSVHEIAAPALTEFMRAVSFCGSTVFLTALFILIAAAFYYFRRKRALVLFALAMLGSTILLVVLKTVFRRARPDAYFDYALPSSYSFPSGHSFSSLCFYGILAALLTARIENRFAQIAIWIFAILLILLIGLSRVYLGVHYPSDVMAGYTAGLVWIVTVGLGDFILKRRSSRNL